MADTVSGPVGTEQNVLEDGVFLMSTVGAMNTSGRDTVVSEISHVPTDKFVYLMTTQSGNELSFVSTQPVTLRPDSHVSGLSPRLAGPHSSDHVVRASHVVNMGALSSTTWRRNTDEIDRPLYRTTLEMEVAETKQMLSQQQVALSALTETIKSLQTEIGKKNNGTANGDETTNQVRPSTGNGVDVNKSTRKSKVHQRHGFFSHDSDSDSSESEEVESDDDCNEEPHNDVTEEPPTKQAKMDGVGPENGSKVGISKLSKIVGLFNDKSDRGPNVNENLAKSVNRGVTNTFKMKSVLEFADNYKPPENCEFLRVPILNEELFFEDSIANRFKKNDGMLQKTQTLLTKGITPLVQLLDKLMEDESEDSEVFDLATDSLTLLAYTHRDISTIRRKFLKPAVAKKYKRLCSAEIPLTANLLGDDLEKQLKSINEHKKIGAQMTNESSRKRFYERDYQQPSTSHRSDYGSRNTGSSHSQPFLYRPKGNNTRYKKGRGNSQTSYNNNNNNNNKRNK